MDKAKLKSEIERLENALRQRLPRSSSPIELMKEIDEGFAALRRETDWPTPDPWPAFDELRREVFRLKKNGIGAMCSVLPIFTKLWDLCEKVHQNSPTKNGYYERDVLAGGMVFKGTNSHEADALRKIREAIVQLKASLEGHKSPATGFEAAYCWLDSCKDICDKALEQAWETPTPSAPGAAIPMLLVCPACGERHIDEGEFATKEHHTHACQECGHVWRPAVVPTTGVRFLPGYKNK